TPPRANRPLGARIEQTPASRAAGDLRRDCMAKLSTFSCLARVTRPIKTPVRRPPFGLVAHGVTRYMFRRLWCPRTAVARDVRVEASRTAPGRDGDRRLRAGQEQRSRRRQDLQAVLE